MPYCPKCKSEFQPGVARCAECDVELVASLPDETPAELVEVFRAENRSSADRVCTVILDGLECFIRERGSRAFPTASMASGLLFVAVPADQADRALDLLDEAMDDGALTAADGEVLETESPPAE